MYDLLVPILDVPSPDRPPPTVIDGTEPVRVERTPWRGASPHVMGLISHAHDAEGPDGGLS
jgi:hypothetical protein